MSNKNKLISIVSVAAVFLIVVTVFNQSLKVAQAPANNMAAVGALASDVVSEPLKTPSMVSGSFSFSIVSGIDLYQFSIDGSGPYLVSLTKMKVLNLDGSLKSGFTVTKNGNSISVAIASSDLSSGSHNVTVKSAMQGVDGSLRLSKESLGIKNVNLSVTGALVGGAVGTKAAIQTQQNIVQRFFTIIKNFFLKLFGISINNSGTITGEGEQQGIKVDTAGSTGLER